MTAFSKNAKYPIFGPFFPKFGPKWHQLQSPNFLQKIRKNNEPILRKTLN